MGGTVEEEMEGFKKVVEIAMEQVRKTEDESVVNGTNGNWIEAIIASNTLSNEDKIPATTQPVLIRTLERVRYRESGPCKASYNLTIVHSAVVQMPVLEMNNELFKPSQGW